MNSGVDNLIGMGAIQISMLVIGDILCTLELWISDGLCKKKRRILMRLFMCIME